MAAGRIRFPLAGKVPRARADKYLGASQDRKAHVTRDRAGDEFGLSRSHRPEDFAERRLATRQDLPERSLGLDFSIPLARTSDRERVALLNISSAGLAGRPRSGSYHQSAQRQNARSGALAGAQKTFRNCLNY
jgi:hypothetical protein